MTVWLIRAGKWGERESLAQEKGLAVVGWDEVPDLAKFATRDELNQALKEIFVDEKGKTLSNWESQLWPFAHLIAKGDMVVLPLKSRPAILLGKVTGQYRYRSDLNDAHHSIPVDWVREVPRSAFAQDLLFSFGAFLTVCRIQRNEADSRVAAVLNGKSDPAISGWSGVAREGGRKSIVEDDEGPTTADDTTAAVNLMEVADDLIRLKIATAFKGHKLAALIGAILKTQGYSVFVSPSGADGGVDVIAGKGPLGFDSPRLVVQVKSQDAPVDVSVLRELQGVMRQFSAERGLLVAWGGVNKALEKEARRQFFEIRIWNSNDIVRAVQESYEHLPEDIQGDLPLKRIWVLAETQ